VPVLAHLEVDMVRGECWMDCVQVLHRVDHMRWTVNPMSAQQPIQVDAEMNQISIDIDAVKQQSIDNRSACLCYLQLFSRDAACSSESNVTGAN
jgi:hypothetical protein